MSLLNTNTRMTLRFARYGKVTLFWSNGTKLRVRKDNRFKGHFTREGMMNNITINGLTMCESAWARHIGISRQAFQQRLKRKNEGENILRPRYQCRTRPKYRSKYRERFGYTTKELASISSLSGSTIRNRIKALDNNPLLKKLYKILVAEASDE